MTAKNIHIQFISDDENLYFEIQELLSKVPGYKINLHWCRDYQYALEANVSDFDIALYDDNLQSGDSFKFLKYISQNNLQIPVIIISDGTSRNRDIRLLREGASDYLIKGKIRAGYLYRAIVYSLERSSKNKETVTLQTSLMREQKLNSLGELAGNIAIKLGTNLEAIYDIVDSLNEKTNNETFERRIKKCKKFINESRNVINNLLAFSPAEIEIIPNYNLKDLIIEATDFLNQATKNKTRIMSIISSEDDILVDLNPSQIKQAIANLVLNAQEAMPSGGTIQIKLKIATPSELNPKLKSTNRVYAAIKVKDQGVGIKKEYMNRLFEPTFTTKDKHQGLGLGLTNVFNVVRAHNGWIEVESTENEGSTFTIFLPLSEGEKKQKDKGSQRGFVLVIEPDSSQTQICKLYFDAASIESRVFSNNQDALTWYSKNKAKIDFIMISCLKDDEVEELVDNLREINPKVKIIYSGYLENSTEENICQKGVIKVFPPENRYLATISWVGELGL